MTGHGPLLILLTLCGTLLGCASSRTARPPAVAPLAPGDHVTVVDGVDLGYHVRGKGPVMVVHPGGPGNSAAYLRMPELEHFLTLVYVDPIGTGVSGKVTPGTYTHELYASFVEGLRLHLGLERIWLLGHSYGGEVAQVYAYTYPDHLTGLVLYSAAPRFDATWLDDRRARMAKRTGEPWYGDAMTAIDELEKVRSYAEGAAVVRRIAPFTFADYTARKTELDPFVSALDWALEPNLPWPDGPDGLFDLRPMLSRIMAPTLVLTGRRDWVCGPRYAEELRQGIAGARLQVFERSGHFAHVEEPEAFAAAVRAFVTSAR